MTEVTCANLREMFGDRYRMALEPPARTWNAQWYHLIVCRYGHIYPHGRNLLGFASNRCGAVANRVAALPYATVTQNGSDGMNITFPVEHFNEVAAIVHPRRRRRLSDEQRAKSVSNLRRFRKQYVAGAPQNDLERVQTTLDDQNDQGAIASDCEATKRRSTTKFDQSDERGQA
jgi:hypothetical protein